MFDVTNFLMRWLFLSNLVRDAPDILSLPYNPGVPPPVAESSVGQNQYIQNVESQTSTLSSPGIYQQQFTDRLPQRHHRPKVSRTLPIHASACEDIWRDQCLRDILSYPPGTNRLLIIDAMRAELVERLSCSLIKADQILEQHERYLRIEDENKDKSIRNGTPASFQSASKSLTTDEDNRDGLSDIHQLEIDDQSGEPSTFERSAEEEMHKDDRSYSQNIIRDIRLTPQERSLTSPSAEDINDAHKTARVVRDYLPQLVSIVLKSPPAFDHTLVDPVDKLRRLIVKRCVDDANWGVDMCWLLEAEVGRAWKTLFEHRQQTGKRLIIVLQAEKAAVLATIGSGKKEAFDLLQDAEQATAFGFTVPSDDHSNDGTTKQYYENNKNNEISIYQDAETQTDNKLPSSLSLRRCSHFGDTMHFIDRLTKISLDVRGVPIVHRHSYLQDSLREINRRIRRRMITRGDVSLDVEDHLGSNDWPSASDITTDMLMYSVHLPVEPKQNSKWPGGAFSECITNEGAVRILNIVVEESRILASRERCPYLVRVEVLDTNLRGNDSRLYASGATGLGATIQEALSMSASTMINAATTEQNTNQQLRFGNCHIPPELLSPSATFLEKSHRPVVAEKEVSTDPLSKEISRGGWQTNETFFYSESPEADFTTSPYDIVRETEYQQLHQQMYNDHGMSVPAAPNGIERRSPVSTGETLLDKIFGQPWDDKCEEIRQASPYGNVEGWRLASFIMKAGEDIRREALVMQIITKLNDWFQSDISEPFRPYMRPYTIMCAGGDAGLVECLSNAKSVDEVKKGTDHFKSLRDYFERAYGAPTGNSVQHTKSSTATSSRTEIPRPLAFEEAQDNFLRSLVGYSLICYILQIKDRHNANILIDRDGNIVHIDFGFVLGDTPKMCKVPIFSETAPFKLSDEYWEVLGGWNINQGGLGVRFCQMFEHAFACAAVHVDEIASLVEATMLTLTQNTRQARLLANGVKNRLKMRGPAGSREQKAFIMELVNAARISLGTSTYDWLQRNMNGYQ